MNLSYHLFKPCRKEIRPILTPTSARLRRTEKKRKKLTVLVIVKIDSCVYVFLRAQTAGVGPRVTDRWSCQAETCSLRRHLASVRKLELPPLIPAELDGLLNTTSYPAFKNKVSAQNQQETISPYYLESNHLLTNPSKYRAAIHRSSRCILCCRRAKAASTLRMMSGTRCL